MKDFQKKCRQIRENIIEILYKGQRGHAPSAFSMVEILVTLYFYHCKIDIENLAESDRILLSKGHGCLALYAILQSLNAFDKNEYEKFCKVGGILGGHPTRGKVKGVEITSGSLGHGPSIGLGRALACKLNKNNKKVFVIVGDGECNEGSVWEAALSANKNKLSNYTILIDYNKQQSYDTVDKVCPLDDFASKWKSFGFETFEVDMTKNPKDLLGVLKKQQNQPRAIICHTIKGQGSKVLEGDLSWHHVNKVSQDDYEKLLRSIY